MTAKEKDKEKNFKEKGDIVEIPMLSVIPIVE